MTASRTLINIAFSEGSANTASSPIADLNSGSNNLRAQPQVTVLDEGKAVYNEDHPAVVAVKDNLIQICRKRLQHYDLSDLNLSLDDHVKQSLEHFIKECIEVISWLEKDNNNHSVIYYANTLPACVKKATELLIKLDLTSFSSKTIHLDKTFLKETQVDFTNIKKNMAGETLKGLQLTPSTTKVYLPTCYGYGDEDKEDGLYQQLFATIKKFLNSGILPENIFVYFGPYEPVGYSIEEREIREEQVLQDLLLNAANFLKAQKINVLVYKDKYKLFPKKGLTPTDWVDSAEYKHAQNVFYQLFVEPKNADLHDKFRFDVINYLKPKFDKLKSKALVVLPQEKNQHASDAKADCGQCLQAFEERLMPIRFQIAYNTYMLNCLTLIMSQRDESRFHASPTSIAIIYSEVKIEEKSEIIMPTEAMVEEKIVSSPMLHNAAMMNEHEEEKTQLYVPTVRDRAAAFYQAIKKARGLSEQLKQDLPLLQLPAQRFKAISEFISQNFSLIENTNDLLDEHRLAIFTVVTELMISRQKRKGFEHSILISFTQRDYDSYFLNSVLNKLLENIGKCSLFTNQRNLSEKTKFIQEISNIKSEFCPLESKVEVFLQVFEKIQSEKRSNSSKQYSLTYYVRETLKSITEIAKAKSLLPSYKIYMTIYIKVVTCPTFDTPTDSLFGFFKSYIRQDLLSEIDNSARANKSFSQSSISLSSIGIDDRHHETYKAIVISLLFCQHILMPTIFEKDTVNTALRERWITLFTEELNSIEKGDLIYKRDYLTPGPWLNSVYFIKPDETGALRHIHHIY